MSHRRIITNMATETYTFAVAGHLRATPETIVSTRFYQEITVNATLYNVINLPSAPVDGTRITIKDSGNATALLPITIAAAAAIDEGIGSQSITAAGDARTFTFSVDEAGNLSDRWIMT